MYHRDRIEFLLQSCLIWMILKALCDLEGFAHHHKRVEFLLSLYLISISSRAFSILATACVLFEGYVLVKHIY